MSNVLPVKEQKHVWAGQRQRFITLGSVAFSILAIVALLTLSPSYVLLMLNRPESLDSKLRDDAADRTEAAKTQTLIATLLPVARATSSPMDAISEALLGRPSDITINRMTYTDGKQKTIVLGGTAPSREGINALRKGLEAKGIYESVTVPVGDLIGATGNQFTITLVTKN
jgi:hypothetical protein